MTVTVERGDFWEFQARCAAVDLELARVRATGEALTARRNGLVEAFARQHGLDPERPVTLDDVTLTATQDT